MSLLRLDPAAGEGIVPESTPNPDTLRFAVDRTLTDRGGKDFPDPADAGASPLARRLFAFEGVAALYVGRDFVTVTKAQGLQWNEPIVEAIRAAIRGHLASGEPAITGPLSSHAAAGGGVETRIQRKADGVWVGGRLRDDPLVRGRVEAQEAHDVFSGAAIS